MGYVGDLFEIVFWRNTILRHPIKGGLALLGFITLLKRARGWLCTLYKHLLRPARSLRERYGNCWALITDISDPVGASYAMILGRKFNLLILHEGESIVDQEVIERVEKSGSRIITMTVNYHEGNGSKSIKQIQDFFADKTLGLVIINQLNTVTNRKVFKEGKEAEKSMFFQETVIFPVLLLRSLVPMMLKKEKKGGIIGLSHQYIFPYNSFQIAAKAFLEGFFRSLGAEYRGKLDVIHFEVGSVIGLNTGSLTKFCAISPKTAVKAQLAEIGYEKTGYGHWKHYLEKYLINN